jgi:hypothetical protein
MYEINKPVAYESLMEAVMELVTDGWDEKTNNFKPGIQAQLNLIRSKAKEAIGVEEC